MRTRIIFLLLLAACGGTQAQTWKSSSLSGKDTTITDTVFYYFNKQYFKSGIPLSYFPRYRSASATGTQVSHVGSRFENTDPNLEISGLVAYVAKDSICATTGNVPVEIYLCELDQNGMPVLNALDYVVAQVKSKSYQRIGGTFASGKTYKMKSDYAVLIRNVSMTPGDTIKIPMVAGKTFTNSNATAAEKISDGYGYVRWNNSTFYSTTNFTALTYGAGTNTIQAFGVGTSYEMCVAPIVTYTLHSEQRIPASVQNNTICIFDVHTFTNVSSPEMTSRFYNMYEFCRKWNQNPAFHPSTTPVNGWPSDSAVFWNFEANEQAFGWSFPPGPRMNLPYNSKSNTIGFATSHWFKDVAGEDSAVCWPANKFFTRWRSMGIYGRGKQSKYEEDFNMCTDNCHRANVGITEAQAFAGVTIYPNPFADRVTISGLPDNCGLSIIDLSGRELVSVFSQENEIQLKTSHLPAGLYFVKVAFTGVGDAFYKLVKE
jgi:hypothetical protein